MLTQVLEAQAVGADRLSAPTLSGAKAIARAAGVNERTVRRWFEADLLAGLVWRGPFVNSPLKIRRADVPRLRDLAGRAPTMDAA